MIDSILYDLKHTYEPQLTEKGKEKILDHIVEQQKEIERLNAIIDKLNEKGKFLTEVANEKQNRIDRAYTYNNYLREKCKFRLNDGHLRKMGKILIGEETELREIPRIGVDKE